MNGRASGTLPRLNEEIQLGWAAGWNDWRPFTWKVNGLLLFPLYCLGLLPHLPQDL
jgi:hypothetical protein